MTNREAIRQLTDEMLARDAVLRGEIEELREKRHTAMRKVVRALPEVPPSLRHYLCEPDPSTETRT